MNQNKLPDADRFAAQRGLLVKRLLLILASLHPLLMLDVQHVLAGQGKLLFQSQANEASNHPTAAWALLPLLIAQYIDPTMNNAALSSVGVAVECFVCALDLLDDVEDEDQTPVVQELGVARTLNVSTTLLMMSQQALLSLTEQGIPTERVLRLMEVLLSSALHAAAGQHRDLLAEQRSAHDITEEECIEIAAGKAGAIMRLACLVGAILVNADGTLCDLFSEMGELLGIAHQLDNDSHDLYYLLQGQSSTVDATSVGMMPRSVKSDLARGKKTLPVVLAAKNERMLHENAAKAKADQGSEGYNAAVHEGIITTWGISLLYRERARECLQKIEAWKPVAPPLRMLLGFE
jgi:geranylgeranyl pyrophosphate synthase